MPDNTARVGIVVRTKNRPWFLRRALRDVAAQHYALWRVHVVNDGGDRDEVDLAIAELPDDVRRRVSVHHNATSRGRSAAANEGVRALATEFVILHDDDDLWHPRFLAATVDWLDTHPEDIGVVVRTEIVYEEADPGGTFREVGRALFWPEMNEVSYSDLLRINRAVPIAYLYRRRVHDEVGLYREDIHAAEDWEFNLRVTLRHHVGFIDGDPLAFWMQRRGVGGDLGNSMFALAGDHDRYDRRIRDEALRGFELANGPGLALHLARFIPEELSRIVRDEVARQLEERPSDLDRVRRRLRRLGWRKRK